MEEKRSQHVILSDASTDTATIASSQLLPTQCLGVWGIICLTDRRVDMLPSSYACAMVASVVVVSRRAASFWLIGL